jgi:hypothetical protein
MKKLTVLWHEETWDYFNTEMLSHIGMLPEDVAIETEIRRQLTLSKSFCIYDFWADLDMVGHDGQRELDRFLQYLEVDEQTNDVSIYMDWPELNAFFRVKTGYAGEKPLVLGDLLRLANVDGQLCVIQIDGEVVYDSTAPISGGSIEE